MATKLTLDRPVSIMSKQFHANKAEYFQLLLEQDPVHQGRMMGPVKTTFLSKYEDCVAMLKDPRFVRDRRKAGGKTKMPIPLPKGVQAMTQSMILEDDPEHYRLRNLVHKAFTPKRLRYLDGRIDEITNELLDSLEPQGTVELTKHYSLPIPVTVIQEMLGIDPEDMPMFQNGLKALTDGMSGITILRTFVWDMPKVTKFTEYVIDKKRANPGDDILTALVEAEEDGDRLSQQELIAMVYLLIFAGFETTVHLISNAVLTLLQHPEQLALLRGNMELMDSAVEEILRFAGPIESTKPQYAAEDVEIRGKLIKKGTMVMPLFGAANRDPDVFENPNTFDITRQNNKHLGFGQGIHYCLGAPLARMEAKKALINLLTRNPNLQLAIPESEIEWQRVPAWHRLKQLPVTFG